MGRGAKRSEQPPAKPTSSPPAPAPAPALAKAPAHPPAAPQTAPVQYVPVQAVAASAAPSKGGRFLNVVVLGMAQLVYNCHFEFNF